MPLTDLKSRRWIQIKGLMFLGIGLLSAGMLVLERPTLKVGLLVVLCVWAFCRAYYFAFYVIEHYVDPSFRFSGLGGFVHYWLRRRR